MATCLQAVTQLLDDFRSATNDGDPPTLTASITEMATLIAIHVDALEKRVRNLELDRRY